jgi:hypothetical protein
MQFGQLKRREFITLLGGVTVWPLTVGAQKPRKLFRIGYLNAAIPGVLPVEQRAIAAFIMGLAEHGLVQDRDFVIEYRLTDSQRSPQNSSTSRSMFSSQSARSRPWL